jgi:hypothetical protein
MLVNIFHKEITRVILRDEHDSIETSNLPVKITAWIK